MNRPPIPRHPPFPRLPFGGGLIALVSLALFFQFVPLDLSVAHYFYRQPLPWPGDHWAWTSALYRYGQAPAVLVGLLGGFAFAASFAAPRYRSWRGPGLYLLMLLVLGPGLLINGLSKALAGRPRPLETLGFGGLWDYQGPLQWGLPGRGLSFLSGHCASVWYFFGLCWLRPKGRRGWTMVAVLALGAAMAFTRVSQGAHWLSDTLLCGLALFTLSAALSPLIHWQAGPKFWRRPGLAWALALGILAWLSLSNVRYEDRRFVGLDDPAQALAPQQRRLEWAQPAPPQDVTVSVELLQGDLRARFDQTGPALPLSLSAQFWGQGLPGGHETLEATTLQDGQDHLSVGAQTLAYRFSESLRGLWLYHQGHADLALPRDLGIDARLHLAAGTLTIGPFPEGRRVLLARLPEGASPPTGFQPYGGSAWLREGADPLISLDLLAPSVRFED